MATDADLKQALDMVQVAFNNKADEDAKTAKANADAATAAQAASAAGQSQSEEVTASALTASSLKAAYDFLGTLVNPPPVIPPVPGS